jgi:hypothetical protein
MKKAISLIIIISIISFTIISGIFILQQSMASPYANANVIVHFFGKPLEPSIIMTSLADEIAQTVR